MQTFLNLLATGRLDISSLITHTYSLTEAPRAYDMILENKEDFTGIVIEYDTEKKLQKRIEFSDAPYQPGEVHAGFIGAGSFADRKSTRLNSSHVASSYAVFCLKKKTRDRCCV